MKVVLGAQRARGPAMVLTLRGNSAAPPLGRDGHFQALLAMIRCRLTLLAILACSLEAGAQATPLVPPSAVVYRDIERMAAIGLVDTLLVGVRPFTEREVVHLLGEARANLDRVPRAREWAEQVISAGLARYDRRKHRPLDYALVELAQMSSPVRPAPSDENGRIDADINPLAANRGGRPLAEGTTIRLETAHSVILGRHLAVTVSPRAALAGSGAAIARGVTMQTANVTAMAGSLAIEAGRDYMVFGQAPGGGIVLSDNAPSLDMIRVWNDRPWWIPLFSDVFGWIRGSAFIADLGGVRQNYAHTKLIGYHVAGLPHPQFEIGVEVLDAMGGDGGQAATGWERFLDVIPVVDAFRTKSDFQFSNKLAGMDVRWRMPHWAGFELYVEGAADDFDGRNLSRGFLADAAYAAGVSLSCLVQCGRAGVRLEYRQTGIRYYTHSHYPLTKRGDLLGDPLGPRGVGGYLTIDGATARRGRGSLTAAFEVRSGNTYRTETTGPNDEGFHFVLNARRPGEKRGRLLATWSSDDSRPLWLRAAAGVERVSNFAFVQGADRTNWLSQVAIVLSPR